MTACNLSHSILLGATCFDTDFQGADLEGADVSGLILTACAFIGANLSRAKLQETQLAAVSMGNTVLADLDLSRTHGLEQVKHVAPSSISIDTLYRSRGQIPTIFLRAAGIPEQMIACIEALSF